MRPAHGRCVRHYSDGGHDALSHRRGLRHRGLIADHRAKPRGHEAAGCARYPCGGMPVPPRSWRLSVVGEDAAIASYQSRTDVPWSDPGPYL
jgi:hypothetical protein